jgi:hypothetical protein
MTRTKYLKGECEHCGGHLEFPAENIGLAAPCPHCGKDTELMLATPLVEPTVPRKVIVWTTVTVFILVAGLVALLAGLSHYEKQAAQHRPKGDAAPRPETNTQPEAAPAPGDPVAQAGFQVSPIRLEKTPQSSLVHAVGTLMNNANRQRFGVRVEIDLFDAAGEKVGSAKDYQKIIEPKARWQFRALVVDSKAESAKLASVKEDQ